jgi:hypothetical protein
MAVAKPRLMLSGPPMMFCSGYHAIFEDHVAHRGAVLAHLAIGLAQADPFAAASTRNAVTPRDPCSLLPVRANTVNSCALGALVMKRLVPLRMKLSPSLAR